MWAIQWCQTPQKAENASYHWNICMNLDTHVLGGVESKSKVSYCLKFVSHDLYAMII